ncbi:hypothetical protein ACFV3R_03125 [Streptomyces sp. NPDC059740]|uniref:SCO2584 family spore wall biosynthesis protein n=1 Tax=Streptomyces sp. NPDC059740 TaxID=3346926 RepID=UPI003657E05D
MPDEAGGTPFPDGDQPEEHEPGSHGWADEDFASVVFDEEFIRSALFHEPSAAERLLAAAEARAEAERHADADGRRPVAEGVDLPPSDWTGFGGDRAAHLDPYAEDGPYGPYGGALRPYRGRGRWHRPVALLLAMVMGVGLVALALSAVIRGSENPTGRPTTPPTSRGVGETTPSPSGGRGPTVQPELLPPAVVEGQ